MRWTNYVITILRTDRSGHSLRLGVEGSKFVQRRDAEYAETRRAVKTCLVHLLKLLTIETSTGTPGYQQTT